MGMTGMKRMLGGVIAIGGLALAPVAAASVVEVRDDFSSRSYANNDGTVDWRDAWVESDT